MMFSTLGRYFLWRFAIVTFWFYVGTILIVFLIDFSETSSRLAGGDGPGAAAAFYLTALRLPLILQQTIPFITLFSGMTTLVTLNRKYELVVTRAAGISVWQFMTPFVVATFVIGLAATMVLNPLTAWTQRTALQMEADFKPGNQASKGSGTPWLRQISGKDDVIVGAHTVLENGTFLVDAVFIHFDSQGRIVLRQDAESAKLKDGYWQLNKVTETRPGAIPAVLESAQVRTNLKQEFVQERLTQPETIAFFDLPQKIQAAKSFGVSTKALETQFHSLLSLPFLLVAMMLIAGTVSLKFTRFNQSRSMITGGIISGFVLYVATVLVKAFGSSGVVPPFVAAWIPVVVAISLGATILLHQEDG